MEYTQLKQLVDQGLSTRAIAKKEDCSQSTIKYWLKKHNLKTITKIKDTVEDRKRKNVVAVNNRRVKLKLLAVEYKGNKCETCGYSKCVDALDFHHLDPNEKDFGIAAKGYTRSWKKVKEELDKCIMLCANCHREIHAEIRGVGAVD